MGLDRVEVRELAVVEVGVLAERGERQRLQVEQLGVRRVLLGQDELAEGDGQRRLGGEPPVAHQVGVTEVPSDLERESSAVAK